eukprot:457420_1
MNTTKNSYKETTTKVSEVDVDDDDHGEEDTVSIYNISQKSSTKQIFLKIFLVSVFLLLCGSLVYTNIKLQNEMDKNCPQSSINITHSNGTSYNFITILNQSLRQSNESLNETELHYLVEDYIMAMFDTYTSNDNIDDNNDTRRRLAWAGPYGSNGGSQFELHDGNTINIICVRTGRFLDSIQIIYSNGGYSVKYGGNGGAQHCYTSPTNCISSINLRSGRFIDGIQFTSSNGHSSGWYGGNGGGFYAINFVGCLRRIKGRAGTFVDQLQFEYY